MKRLTSSPRALSTALTLMMTLGVAGAALAAPDPSHALIDTRLAADGRLTLRGTPGADDVLLRVDSTGTKIEIDDRTNGAGTDYRFDLALVRSIHVFLGAGDDRVIFDDTNGSLGLLRPLEINAGDGDNTVIGSTGSLEPGEIADLGSTIAKLKQVLAGASSLRERAQRLSLRVGEFAATDGTALTQTGGPFLAAAQQLLDSAAALRKASDSVNVPAADQFLRNTDDVLQQVEKLRSLVNVFADSGSNGFIQRQQRLADQAGALGNDSSRVEDLVDRMESETGIFAGSAESLASRVQGELSGSQASFEGLQLQLEQADATLLARAERELLGGGDSLQALAGRTILGGGDAFLGRADSIALEADAINRAADALADSALAVIGKLAGGTAAPGAATPPTPPPGCSFQTTNTISGSGLLIGTAGNDLMTGGSTSDFMIGLGGNDRMYGGAGDDIMFGGADTDDMYGEDGDDIMFGNGGDDCMSGGAGIDVMLGNTGNDFMHGNNGRTINYTIATAPVLITVTFEAGDVMFGNTGDDEMYGDEGLDFMSGNSGKDTMHGNDGFDVMLGNEDDDTMLGEAGKGLTIYTNGVGYTPPIGNLMFGNTGKDQMWGGVDRDIMFGNEDDDTMHGDADIDFMWGNGGNDTMYGDAGNDFMWGNQGNDTMNGGADTDLMFGNENDDTMHGDDGADLIFGNTGNDRMYGDAGTDLMFGNQDNDTMYGGADPDLMFGNQDNDTMYGDTGTDVMFGNEGNDAMNGGAGIDVMFGNGGDDTMHGDDGADLMFGNEGNDTMDGDAGIDGMSGGLGDDTMNGNADTDVMSGGPGADTMHGNDGADFMFGNQDNDTMFGDAGTDVMYGNDGDDCMDGGADTDLMFGNRGDDIMFGGPGADLMFGNEGDDCMDGGDGTDLMFGNQGNDRMFGGSGTDLMFGNEGNDCMNGGDGSDVMSGNQGNDTMLGGPGTDFMWGNEGDDDVEGGDGSDFMWGNQGNDTMYGGNGTDFMFGNQDDDTMYGGPQWDFMSGGSGNDTVDPGGPSSSGVSCPPCLCHPVPPTGSISGCKWQDVNCDSIREPGDNPLPGWTITYTGPVSGTVVTNASGCYNVGPLPAGTYTICEVAQPGWHQTYPPTGCYTVTLGAGQAIDTLSFGNCRTHERMGAVDGGIRNGVPAAFALHEAHPNPFNPIMVIAFDLPKASLVTLSVFDASGREVATLVDRKGYDAGTYQFEFNGGKLASGVYMYRLLAQPTDGSADVFQSVKKMILVK